MSFSIDRTTPAWSPRLMRRFLVTDVGGTHARMGLASWHQRHGILIERQHTYRTSDFPSLAAVIEDYLLAYAPSRPEMACVAVAGPVTGDIVALTNLD